MVVDGQEYHFDRNSLKAGENDFQRIMHTFEQKLESGRSNLT